MKPNRKAQWELDWQDRQTRYREIAEAHGYKDLSWAEREKLKTTMSPEEWAKFEKEQEVLYREVRDEWEATAEGLQAQGQIELNIRNNELDAFCQVFQRADRILTGLSNVDVGVNDDKSTEIPAWSDGKSVTFNVGAMKELSEDTLMSLHGLNYHEVSHLLYTPRVGSELGAWVKEKSDVSQTGTYNQQTQEWEYAPLGDIRYRYAFNLLEDFRAENYLVTKYPSVAPFLTAVVAEYAVSDKKVSEELEQVFLLLAGRPYLPNELVRLSAEAYARANGVDKTKQLWSVSNAYRSLVFPRDYAKAKELIEAVVGILPDQSKLPELPSGCGHRPVLRNGRVAGTNEQEKLSASSPMDNLSQEELNKMFDDIMSNKPEEANSDSDQQGGQGQTIGGDSTNNGKNSDDYSLSDSLKEALEKAIEKATQDHAVQRKLAETSKAIRKQSGSKAILPKQSRSMETPKLADVMAVRLFTQELERIRIDSDPDWERERPTGKLNVRRAINADVNDINKLFDRWTMGNDNYDIEAVILLDRSGSMYSQMEATCKASWIIKRSLEKINANVSVLTFNESSRILYSADEKAQANYASVTSSGSTDPKYALFETERIMSGSNKQTKLLFLLTDGQFYGGDNDKSIQRLKAMGVHTNLVFLGHESWVKWATENGEQVSHGVHNFRVISEPLDLVKVAKDVVRHETNKAVR